MSSDVQRHPIRGAFWGVLFGFGLFLILVGRKVVALGTWMPFAIVMAGSILLNVLWAMFAPARKAKPPKGYSAPPLEPVTVPATEQWSVPPPPPSEPAAPPVPPATGNLPPPALS